MKKLKYIPLLIAIFLYLMINIWSEDYRLMRLFDKIGATALIMFFVFVLIDAYFIFKNDSKSKNE